MDRLAQELKARLDRGEEYHLAIEAGDWMIIKLEGMSMYSVMCNVEPPSHFRRLEDALGYLLMHIGYWRD